MSESAPRPEEDSTQGAPLPGSMEAAPRLVAHDHRNQRPIFAFILYVIAVLMLVIALAYSFDADQPLRTAPLWAAAVVVGSLGVITQLLERIKFSLDAILDELRKK